MSRSRGRHVTRMREGGGLPALVGALAVGLGVLGAGLAAQEQETRQERAEAAHEVRPGDTLWDLARRYLQDPFRWDEIYRLNTGIVQDPHWIYPGQNLALPDAATAGRVVGVAVRERRPDEAPARDAPAEAARERPADPVGAPARPAARPQEAGRAAVSGFGGESVFDRSPDSGDILGELGVEQLRRSPLVSASDFHRASFLVPAPEGLRHGVTARKLEQNPLNLNLPASVRSHARVVVALEGLDAAPGDELLAFRWGKAIRERGRVAQPVAMLRVTDVTGDSARALVGQVFGDYQVGHPVVHVESFDPEAYREHDEVSDGLWTRLLGFEVEQPLLGRGDFVYLDAGERDGLRIGDELAVFPAQGVRSLQRWEDRLAELRVVRVRGGTATARVQRLVDPGVRQDSPARLVRRATGSGG